MNSNSAPNSDSISRLTKELNRLPGVGPKSAQRMVFYLLKAPQSQVEQLANSLIDLKNNVSLCSVCFNVTQNDPCDICGNQQRDKSLICVVEQPQDIVAIEHTGVFKGVYHVLHGAISPSDGVGINEVRIKELTDRLNTDVISEVILATNTNLEGEQTAMYLNHLIEPLGIKVTRLARGLPFGAELEYADDNTISRALEGRQSF